MDNLQQVILPKKIFSSMIEALQKWQRLNDEIEDFLLASDSSFLAKMSKARQEHSRGVVRDLDNLKSEL